MQFEGTTTVAPAKVTATVTSTTAAATEAAALMVTGKTVSVPVMTTTDVEAATSAGTVKTTMTTTTGYVEKLLPHPVYAWKQMIPLSILGEKNFHSSIA